MTGQAYRKAKSENEKKVFSQKYFLDRYFLMKSQILYFCAVLSISTDVSNTVQNFNYKFEASDICNIVW